MLKNDGALIDAFEAISNRFFNRDNGSNAIHSAIYLSDDDIVNIYRSYTLIQKITDTLPQKANSKDVIIKQGKSDIDTGGILSLWRNLEVNTVKENYQGVNRAFAEAGMLARQFGNAYIILGINDGQADFSQPVNEQNINSIEWLAVRDKTRLRPYPNDRNLYQMTLTGRNQLPSNNSSAVTIHRSRILPFHGVKLLGYSAERTDYEDDSVIQSVFNEFMAFTTGVASGASMLNSHSVFKYKLAGLNRLTLQNNSEDLQKRFMGILRGLNSMKGLIFDAQSEDADFINRTYGGVSDIMTSLRDVLVAVSRMPHSYLFGSPTGGAFSESGASDRYTMADNVACYQYDELLPNHMRLLKLTCLAKNSLSKGIFPDDISIEYPSVLQLTRKEEAELRKINAETDKIYLESNALAIQEVRNRFEGSEYNTEITLLEGQPNLLEEETEPVLVANSDSVTIEGKKVRIGGQLLPLSEYGEDEDDIEE